MIARVPRELGRPRRLYRTCGSEPGLQLQDEPRAQRWYRRAKETERGETDGGESERLIVPTSRGNRPEGPRGGKGTPSQEPLEGNMTGTPRPEDVSTKQQRIAELARNAPDM